MKPLARATPRAPPCAVTPRRALRQSPREPRPRRTYLTPTHAPVAFGRQRRTK
ncbi:hypothetical protein JYU34_022062 [Plutella xylostella]|uniref:Uncharacterized protein n=1 Tax=Plutella xylostella TaxID=51655 RepID=A0ABQ7PQP2_PLUXY|nr:hypothetical protein JYU34_022062 [Plutella xylostella]